MSVRFYTINIHTYWTVVGYWFHPIFIRLTSHWYFSSPILQEKVEEDRYIRAREAQIAAAKASAVAAETKAAELAAKSQQLIETKTAWMNEVADLLAQAHNLSSRSSS